MLDNPTISCQMRMSIWEPLYVWLVLCSLHLLLLLGKIKDYYMIWSTSRTLIVFLAPHNIKSLKQMLILRPLHMLPAEVPLVRIQRKQVFGGEQFFSCVHSRRHNGSTYQAYWLQMAATDLTWEHISAPNRLGGTLYGWKPTVSQVDS